MCGGVGRMSVGTGQELGVKGPRGQVWPSTYLKPSVFPHKG